MERRPLTLTEAVWLGATVFFVAFVSALGILLAVLGGMYAYYEDRKVMLIAYCALAGLALALELLAL